MKTLKKSEVDAHQLHNLFKLFLTLTERKMTISEMIDLTEQSRRSIYRFLNIFRDNGIIIEKWRSEGSLWHQIINIQIQKK